MFGEDCFPSPDVAGINHSGFSTVCLLEGCDGISSKKEKRNQISITQYQYRLDITIALACLT